MQWNRISYQVPSDSFSCIHWNGYPLRYHFHRIAVHLYSLLESFRKDRGGGGSSGSFQGANINALQYDESDRGAGLPHKIVATCIASKWHILVVKHQTEQGSHLPLSEQFRPMPSVKGSRVK